jgi:hypothetical protein
VTEHPVRQRLVRVLLAVTAGGLTGAIVGTYTIGAGADATGTGPSYVGFWSAVVVASLLAFGFCIDYLLHHRRGPAALAAIAFVVCAQLTSLPGDAGQGPIVASNDGTSSVLIAIGGVNGRWLLAPGDEMTLLDNRPRDKSHAYVYDPITCEQTDSATIGPGPVLLRINDDLRFQEVGPLSTSALKAVPATDHGC